MLDRMSHESRDVVRQLLAQGYEAYYVGGCVRDAWLGRTIQDIDIATSATPEQVMACFPRTAPTGLQHGTVMVIGAQATYEVTTFRIEGEYEAYRRPKGVAFTEDVRQDLMRRDFTMNAMAMNVDGELIDPFGGQADLQAGLLRCVGDARQRFSEDALRMLRCVRFAASYQLEIEPHTWKALAVQAPLLRHVAMERVRAELQRMVAGSDPARAWRLLLASQLALHMKRPWVLPLDRWHAHDALLDALSALQEPHLRWVLLMLVLATQVADVRHALQALTFSRAELSAVIRVLGLHEELADTLGASRGAQQSAPSEANVLDAPQLARIWKLAAVRHHPQIAADWLKVMHVLDSAIANQPSLSGHEVLSIHQEQRSVILTYGQLWLDEMPCSQLTQLAVTGHELIQALQRPPGPWLSARLQLLLEQVALGEISNDRAGLLAFAIDLDKKGENRS